MGFSLASMWIPLLGSLKWGRAAMARRDSVRTGMVARADAPAANRKKERRDKPLQKTGSIGDCIRETPQKVLGLGIACTYSANRMAATEPSRMWALGVKGFPITQGTV